MSAARALPTSPTGGLRCPPTTPRPDHAVRGARPSTADEEHKLSSLPTSTHALWALLADVLQALQRAGEDPRLEGAHDWRLRPTDHTPGIRRAPEHGTWQRMVEWNTDGACRWTAVQGGSRQWPGAAQLTAVEALAAKARTLLERDEAYANGDAPISTADLGCEAWDLLKNSRGTPDPPPGQIARAANAPEGTVTSMTAPIPVRCAGRPLAGGLVVPWVSLIHKRARSGMRTGATT